MLSSSSPTVISFDVFEAAFADGATNQRCEAASQEWAGLPYANDNSVE
jgi:hypothetical protein